MENAPSAEIMRALAPARGINCDPEVMKRCGPGGHSELKRINDLIYLIRDSNPPGDLYSNGPVMGERFRDH